MQAKDQYTVASTTVLGNLIRAQRRKQGLILQDVSNHAGFGVRFISEIERGKGTAEIGKVLELCMLMGIDLVAKFR